MTTVSPTYASEALTGSAAGWLRATLAKPEVRSKFKVGLPTGKDAWGWMCLTGKLPAKTRSNHPSSEAQIVGHIVQHVSA